MAGMQVLLKVVVMAMIMVGYTAAEMGTSIPAPSTTDSIAKCARGRYFEKEGLAQLGKCMSGKSYHACVGCHANPSPLLDFEITP